MDLPGKIFPLKFKEVLYVASNAHAHLSVLGNTYSKMLLNTKQLILRWIFAFLHGQSEIESNHTLFLHSLILHTFFNGSCEQKSYLSNVNIYNTLYL